VLFATGPIEKEIQEVKARRILRIGFPMLAVLLAPALPGQTLNTLHGFSHNELGYETHSGVTVGPNGEIYGATAFGGAYGLGLVYALAPPTSPGGAWTEILLHSFSAAEGQPAPGLLLGPAGAIYGATEFSDSGEGEIFELEPPTGAGTYWREAILHVFSPSNGDGEDPGAAPVFGQQSALYGSTVTGGSIGGGTVYRLSPPSTKAGAWSEQILYSFAGYHGDAKDPLGALALGSQGSPLWRQPWGRLRHRRGISTCPARDPWWCLDGGRVAQLWGRGE
jgi:uncharacterized repeat protein (TIGR03803 family)